MLAQAIPIARDMPHSSSSDDSGRVVGNLEVVCEASDSRTATGNGEQRRRRVRTRIRSFAATEIGI
jgi:hypothetical protein